MHDNDIDINDLYNEKDVSCDDLASVGSARDVESLRSNRPRHFNGVSNAIVPDLTFLQRKYAHSSNSSVSTQNKKKKLNNNDNNDKMIHIPLTDYIDKKDMVNISSNESISSQSLCNEKVNKSSCWACRNGVLTKGAINSNVEGFAKMANIINNNLFKVGIVELEDQIQQIYDKYLKYQIAQINNEEPEEWSLADIRKHLRFCLCDPAVTIRYKIYELETLYKVCSENVICCKSETPNEIEINRGMLRTLTYLSNEIMKLYSEKIESSSAFNIDVTPVSDMKKNKLMHLNRNLI